MRFQNTQEFLDFFSRGLESDALPHAMLVRSSEKNFSATLKEFLQNRFHPLDVFFIIDTNDDEADYGIGQIRNIKDFFSSRPWQDRKIVFIDNAHRLKTEAQNALLKILEEPPPYGLAVVATRKPNLLFPTVRSRLQQIAIGADSGFSESASIEPFFSSDFFEQSRFLETIKGKPEWELFFSRALAMLKGKIDRKIERGASDPELEKMLAVAKKILFLERTLYALNLNIRLQLESALLA